LTQIVVTNKLAAREDAISVMLCDRTVDLFLERFGDAQSEPSRMHVLDRMAMIVLDPMLGNDKAHADEKYQSIARAILSGFREGMNGVVHNTRSALLVRHAKHVRRTLLYSSARAGAELAPE
jgi:hypothetical protein